MTTVEALKKAIRDVPDFPKKGILFKDITPLLQDRTLFKQAIDTMAEGFAEKQIDVVVGVESRGFIFASALAYKLGAGVVIVRKPGKLPYKTYKATYELEYGTDSLEIHQDAIKPGQNVLIVDDLLATGGTVKATAELVKKFGAKICGIVFLIELAFLNGREKLKDYELTILITFEI
jgi:adenine phosphoribosyltransferase